MGIFTKLFSRKPVHVVARTSAAKLETLAKSSPDKEIRYHAARRLDREDIWQYLALHDPDNFNIAMLNCEDLQFLDKLREQKPKEKYFIAEHMDKVAFPLVQKKVDGLDREQLYALVMTGKNDIPEYKYLYSNSISRIKGQAQARITDPDTLFKIAVNTEGDAALSAISRITDPDLLVQIALAPEHNTSKKFSEILSRLHDMDKLQYIADHASSTYNVQLAKHRIREERSLQLCRNSHAWTELRTETDDDGDSPRFDYVYEKCTRCGVVRCSTYISRRFHSADLNYDAME